MRRHMKGRMNEPRRTRAETRRVNHTPHACEAPVGSACEAQARVCVTRRTRAHHVNLVLSFSARFRGGIRSGTILQVSGARTRRLERRVVYEASGRREVPGEVRSICARREACRQV